MPIYNLEEGGIHQQFQNSRKKIQLMGGGYGNGKTTALVIKALQVAVGYPGANMLLARETYPKLNDTLRKEFYKWCPDGWITRYATKDDNTVYMANGTTVNFRYIAQRGKQSEDGSTTSNLLSATYDFVGVDQCEDPGITYKDFRDLMGRLRGNTIYRPEDGDEDDTMPLSGPRWLVLTCNPTHNWVFRELVQPFITWQRTGLKSEKLIVDEKTQEPIIDLLEGSTYINASNLPEDFIRGLESTYKGQMRSRFLMGEWAAFEGLVYPDFDDKSHILTPEQIDTYLEDCHRRHIQVAARESYDFGITSPSCYLLSFIDDFGRVIICDGYYKANATIDEQAGMIDDIREKWQFKLNFDDPIYADPDIFRKKVVGNVKSTGDTIAKLFEGLGIKMRPSSNDILAGIAKVTAYLNGRTNMPNPFTGDGHGPLIFVSLALDWFSTEIQNYFWKVNPSGQRIDEPIDRDDHAMDAVKYLIARLPDPSQIVTPAHALPPQWKFWHEVEMGKR